MRWAIAWLLVAAPAWAQPGSTDALAECKARRHAIAEQASKAATADARAALSATMPECHQREDGAVEVIEPPAPERPDTSPFAPHVELAGELGLAMSTMIDNSGNAAGLGSFFEIEGGYWLRRHVSAAVFASYTSLHDSEYTALFPTGPGRLSEGIYDLQDRVYDFGVRVDWRYRGASAGAGLGTELEQGKAYAMYSSYTFAYAAGNVSAALPLFKLRRTAVELRATGTFSVPHVGTAPGGRELASGRLAIAVRY